MSAVRKSNTYTIILILLFSIGIWVHVKYPIFTIQVTSNSMYPTIKKGDRIICLKRTQSLKFKRGDIIVFQDQNDSSQLLVKRLIGLPGEELTVSKNRVFINSIPVPEYYLSETSIDYTLAAVTIPKGHVFVLGDNRNNSSDSATWGALNFKQVKGKVFLRYWPAARIGATRFSPHKTS